MAACNFRVVLPIARGPFLWWWTGERFYDLTTWSIFSLKVWIFRENALKFGLKVFFVALSWLVINLGWEACLWVSESTHGSKRRWRHAGVCLEIHPNKTPQKMWVSYGFLPIHYFTQFLLEILFLCYSKSWIAKKNDGNKIRVSFCWIKPQHVCQNIMLANASILAKMDDLSIKAL